MKKTKKSSTRSAKATKRLSPRKDKPDSPFGDPVEHLATANQEYGDVSPEFRFTDGSVLTPSNVDMHRLRSVSTVSSFTDASHDINPNSQRRRINSIRETGESNSISIETSLAGGTYINNEKNETNDEINKNNSNNDDTNEYHPTKHIDLYMGHSNSETKDKNKSKKQNKDKNKNKSKNKHKNSNNKDSKNRDKDKNKNTKRNKISDRYNKDNYTKTKNRKKNKNNKNKNKNKNKTKNKNMNANANTNRRRKGSNSSIRKENNINYNDERGNSGDIVYHINNYTSKNKFLDFVLSLQCLACIPIMNPMGTFRSIWNVIVTIVILYTCIEIPYTIAFDITLSLQETTGRLALASDMLLLTDIIINFRTAYFDNYDNLHLVTNPKKIAKR